MAKRRSTSRGLTPTGDQNLDSMQQQLSEQVDSALSQIDLASLGKIRSVSLDGTASGTADIGSHTGYIVVSKDAAAHIYSSSATTVRSDVAVSATLLVF